MAAISGLEARLVVELDRQNLCDRSPDLPAMEMLPGSVSFQRFVAKIINAKDILSLCHPHAEISGVPGARTTKIVGTRYETLTGIVDEPFVQVLVSDETGRLDAWRGRTIAKPHFMIIGTAEELALLSLPRDASGIENLLRRRSGMDTEVDWMLKEIGIDIPALAIKLTVLANSHEDVFIALSRRNIRRGNEAYALRHRRKPIQGWGKLLRGLRNLFEQDRLDEWMRSMVQSYSAANVKNLYATLSQQVSAAAIVAGGCSIGNYVDDSWIFSKTLHDYSAHGATGLSPDFKLNAYSRAGNARFGDTPKALQDEPTFDFIRNSALSQPIAAGTQRTLFQITGNQPLEFAYGAELARLAFIGQRQIARKSGEKGALDFKNRSILGRLAAYKLRKICRATYETLLDRWEATPAATKTGVTKAELDRYLTSEFHFTNHDFFASHFVRSSQERPLTILTDESNFDPFHWQRKPSQQLWRGLAESSNVNVSQVSDRREKLLTAVCRFTPNLKHRYLARDHKFDLAMQLCASVGAHGVPVSRDPYLFERSVRATNKSIVADKRGILRPSKANIIHAMRKLAEAA